MTQQRPNIFFRWVLITTSIFVITILALVACVISDSNAPVKQWLNRNGNALILWEVTAIGVTGLLALVIDRWQTLRAISKAESDSTANDDASAE